MFDSGLRPFVPVSVAMGSCGGWIAYAQAGRSWFNRTKILRIVEDVAATDGVASLFGDPKMGGVKSDGVVDDPGRAWASGEPVWVVYSLCFLDGD